MEDFRIEVPPRADSLETVNMLLKHMVEIGGSDMFLLGSGEVWVSRYGRKYKLTNRRLSDNEVQSLLGRIYNINAPSMLGSAKPIDTSYEFYTEQQNGDEYLRTRYRFRVNAVGCLRNSRNSLTITMRTIPSTPPHWEKYGIEKEIIDITRNLDQGLILMVGATGNGKSTALGAILRDRVEGPNSHTNFVTIEEPIEFVYDEVPTPTALITQMQVGLDVESFYHGVKNSLRMAPNVILVGEARDFETVQAALSASMTGHTVFSTVHANDIPSTFQRLVYAYPGNMQTQAKLDVLQPMSLIMAQRLIPTVDGRRTACREICSFDQADKERLLAAKDMAAEAFKLVESKGKPMVVDAYQKFKDGIISEETYKRMELNYNATKKELI